MSVVIDSTTKRTIQLTSDIIITSNIKCCSKNEYIELINISSNNIKKVKINSVTIIMDDKNNYYQDMTEYISSERRCGTFICPFRNDIYVFHISQSTKCVLLCIRKYDKETLIGKKVCDIELSIENNRVPYMIINNVEFKNVLVINFSRIYIVSFNFIDNQYFITN
jgi:hypothetical protein